MSAVAIDEEAGTQGVEQASQTRDVALGVALAGGRAGLAAARVMLLPARLALRAPIVGPTLQRRTADLAHEGHLARERALAQGEELAATVLSSPEVERLAARVLATMDITRIAGAILEHERTEQLVDGVLANPALERIVIRALESRLVDDLTEQVLASPELERVVEYVATSPLVLDAVGRQSRTLAEEMAANVRRRAESVDNGAERTVRSWLHRPRPQPT
jgi:hypothetical protein